MRSLFQGAGSNAKAMKTGEMLNYSRNCQVCDGTGKVNDEPCATCNGTGAVLDSRVMDAIIKHIDTGQIIGGREARAVAARTAEEIYKIYEDKLDEAYQRGMRDGKGSDQDGN